MHSSKGVQKIKLSKKFHDICVKIGDCKSREEEEQIVSEWMDSVKQNLNKTNLKISAVYENVISLVHLTLLGYDTSFGQINAVNLTQDSQMMTKALGYLACSAILDSKSSLLILIINSTQRDLSSQHPTSMALALTAVCHLVTPDLIPPIIGYVTQCLQHPIPQIRQKAIMCVHSFIKKDPSCVIEFFPELVRLLSDPDLSIVNSVVVTFTALLESQLNIRQICECVPDIINVVSLIQQGQARTEYYHQRTLAPFILVNIFTLFKNLAPHIPELGNEISQIITFALQNGTTECSATSAVLYEAIRTCIATGLINIPQMRGAISLFMSSQDQNYLYIGLGLLSAIPDFADEFQNTVIDCLNHPDSTIRLRTLSLLHAMANESNAQIIIVNMLKFSQKTKNENIRVELADRITDIASKYSPSPIWFAKTMEQLFAIGGDNVRPEVAFTVMRIIDEQCNEEMRKGIVNLYIDIAQSGQRLSNVFVIVISKVIGQYAELSDEYDLDFIALLLCDLADAYQSAREWVLTALLQVTAKLDEVPQQVSDVFENYKQSCSIIAQEISYEASSLLHFKDVLQKVMAEVNECITQTEANKDGFPTGYDQELAFLDEFVADAIENKGAREYIPLDQRDVDMVATDQPKQLKFTYQQPNVNNPNYEESLIVPPGGGPYGPQATKEEDDNNQLDLTGVKMIWGETGVHEDYGQDDQGPMPSIDSQQQQPPKQISMFERLKIQKGAEPTAEELQRKKMAKSLFAGLKKTSSSPQPPQLQATASIEQMSQQQPYGTPLNAQGTPQVYGSPDRVQITEEDYQKLERITSEINTPIPAPIQQLLGQGNPPTQIYQDSQFSIGILAGNATILLAITNISPMNPVLDIKIDLNGADGLQRQVLTHPQNLVAIPNKQTVYYMTQYKFPQQMKGFPDFTFSVNIVYNQTRKASFKIEPRLASLAVFISPVQLTTPQFGSFWKQGGTELVLSLPRTDPNLTLDYLSQVLNVVVHVKTVERIGQEEIFCGMLVSTPFKILIHVKFGSEKIDIKILTKAPALTQAVDNLLRNSIFVQK